MNVQSINPNFITDNSGKKISVVLSMDEFNAIMHEIEEVEDVKSYDEAKKEDDGERILLKDYLQIRKLKNG